MIAVEVTSIFYKFFVLQFRILPEQPEKFDEYNEKVYMMYCTHRYAISLDVILYSFFMQNSVKLYLTKHHILFSLISYQQQLKYLAHFVVPTFIERKNIKCPKTVGC